MTSLRTGSKPEVHAVLVVRWFYCYACNCFCVLLNNLCFVIPRLWGAYICILLHDSEYVGAFTAYLKNNSAEQDGFCGKSCYLRWWSHRLSVFRLLWIRGSFSSDNLSIISGDRWYWWIVHLEIKSLIHGMLLKGNCAMFIFLHLSGTTVAFGITLFVIMLYWLFTVLVQHLLFIFWWLKHNKAGECFFGPGQKGHVREFMYLYRKRLLFKLRTTVSSIFLFSSLPFLFNSSVTFLVLKYITWEKLIPWFTLHLQVMFMTHPGMLFDLALSQEKTWMTIREYEV